MSSAKQKTPKTKRKPYYRNTAKHIVVDCPHCGAPIYKRHLAEHIAQFHAEQSSPALKKPTREGIKGVALSQLSPEAQAEITEQYVIDESGFMVRKDQHMADED